MKIKSYKIIGHEFGAPPIGSTMVWDEPYEAWTVVDAYNTGSPCKSIWSGDPSLSPEMYEPIYDEDFSPTKELGAIKFIKEGVFR